jgi:hypothetical protein
LRRSLAEQAEHDIRDQRCRENRRGDLHAQSEHGAGC